MSENQLNANANTLKNALLAFEIGTLILGAILLIRFWGEASFFLMPTVFSALATTKIIQDVFGSIRYETIFTSSQVALLTFWFIVVVNLDKGEPVLGSTEIEHWVWYSLIVVGFALVLPKAFILYRLSKLKKLNT